MIELGQLEAEHAEFDRRHTRIVAVSVEGPQEAGRTQAEVPHLLVLADREQRLATAADVIDRHTYVPVGGVTAAPTTILIDRQGMVKWLYRPAQYVRRLAPAELLARVDECFAAAPAAGENSAASHAGRPQGGP
jgi:peroxiredoxin